MKYSFHPDAETEFNGAIDYYESCDAGLGYDFSVEVYAAVERIITFPNAWPILDDEIRRCLVRRYPYGILYSQETEEILIVAVMHLHQEPQYWKNRLD